MAGYSSGDGASIRSGKEVIYCKESEVMDMFLADRKIRELSSDNSNLLINPFNYNALNPISYDLETKSFYRTLDGKNETLSSIELNPLESVFVSSKEVIKFPKNIAGIVSLRNSRLRQGLSLESPIYYPGHETNIYFRLTNISNNIIKLNAGEKYASIFFEEISGEVENPYNGTFQREFNFSGMGEYTAQYKSVMHEVENKVNDVKTIERGIYGNVLVLMSIFVALFSLININVNLAESGANTLKNLIVFNLGTVGSIFFLIGGVQNILKQKNRTMLCIGLICFVASIILAIM